MKKMILFLASCFFCCHAVLSQEIEWQKTIGGSGGDELYSIQQTSDGGYILGGYSDSNISGDKTENSNGKEDYWVVKTDSWGNIQWQKTIGNHGHDLLRSVQQTSDGGYILGGYSGSNGKEDYWMIKTDTVGNIQWQNIIGGIGSDLLYSIQQTSDGGYILGGCSNSDSSYDKTENGNGAWDYWIVKTDSYGNIQWDNGIGGSFNDILQTIRQTSDGGYILGGWSNSSISGDKSDNPIGAEDYWIIKTDSSGNIQWQKTIGGSNSDRQSCIEQTSDGGYIIGGYSLSNISGYKTENSFGYDDYWIVKIDSSGNIQWDKTIGGTFRDYIYSIQQSSDGGYILGGWSDSNISGNKTENCNGMDDYWIVKTDSSGNIQWQKTLGGSRWDDLNSIEQTTDGGYILGGSSASNISSDKSQNCKGDWDYWIVKLTDKYNSITGKLFVDNNSNGVQDVGEHALQNKRVSELNTGRFAFSEQNGNYKLIVLDSGNYIVNPSPLSYYNAVPATHAAYFSGIHQTDSLNDFAYQPAGVYNDLCVTLTPMSGFSAGFTGSYMINYKNKGTTTLNGTVNFFLDINTTYVSSNPQATAVTADSIIWNLGTLAPYQSGNIIVTVHVKTGIPLGTLVYSTVRIDPVAGDANPGCNFSAYEVYTVGSFDPNDILVNYATLLTTQFPNPPNLEYIIRFQNTGNSTAFNVKILNPIDTSKLRLNSFQFVSSSHDVKMKWIPGEKQMEFKFDNILLPDSIANEPASHGFIRYRIKPKSSLVAGKKINNRAAIFFDFNASVSTNTAITEIIVPASINQIIAGNGQLKIVPNPAGEEISINATATAVDKAAIKIFDLYGREIYQSEILPRQTAITLNISGLSKGVYMVALQSAEQVYRGRFVKQ